MRRPLLSGVNVVPKDDISPASGDAAQTESAGTTAPSQARHDSTTGRRRLRWGLIALGPLLVLAVGTWLYLTGGRTVSTDDAFVKTDLASISAQVPGQIATVHVRNNQRVERGQVLFELDDSSYRTALQQAEANLALVRDQVAVLRANYQERTAMLHSAEETAAYQQREFLRQQRLRQTGAVSEQQLEQVGHNYEVAQRNLDAMRQQIVAIKAQLGGDADTPTEDLAQYRAALAKRDDAQIALERTRIAAPATGVAANVTLRPGDYVSPGQPMFSLAEIEHLWVEANFKETQLTKVVDGQPATVTVDAYPGVVWRGRVESVSPASGNEFSVLPAENSSGNWVKVVQRIPVRVSLDPAANAPQLRAGMSVTATIDISAPRATPAAVSESAPAMPEQAGADTHG
jgi:membrane fusion protein (multidrug efflux system)